MIILYLEYYQAYFIIFAFILLTYMTDSLPKLMTLVRKEIRNSNLSYRTEKVYLDWIYRYYSFYSKTPLNKLSEKDAAVFLSFLAIKKQVSSSTQNQALHALRFLFRNVLKQNLTGIEYIKSGKKVNIPRVFSKEKIGMILGKLSGEKYLIASLLYGCGLSLNECLSLRIKDISFEKKGISITNDRGKKERILPLPDTLHQVLKKRIETLKYKYFSLSLKNFPGVTIPEYLENKHPHAHKSFPWFYLFPSQRPVKIKRIGQLRLHHRSDTFVRKTLKALFLSSGIGKDASCRTLRHSFAVHLLKDGIDIHTVQKLLGHKNVKSTLIYKHILKQEHSEIKSPLDHLLDHQ